MSSFVSMRAPEPPMSPGEIRGTAERLVRAWQQAGAPPDRYNLVWEAKEYLHDIADDMEGL